MLLFHVILRDLPSGNDCYKKLLNMASGIVDLPIKNADFHLFSIGMLVYQRVNPMSQSIVATGFITGYIRIWDGLLLGIPIFGMVFIAGFTSLPQKNTCDLLIGNIMENDDRISWI